MPSLGFLGQRSEAVSQAVGHKVSHIPHILGWDWQRKAPPPSLKKGCYSIRPYLCPERGVVPSGGGHAALPRLPCRSASNTEHTSQLTFPTYTILLRSLSSTAAGLLSGQPPIPLQWGIPAQEDLVTLPSHMTVTWQKREQFVIHQLASSCTKFDTITMRWPENHRRNSLETRPFVWKKKAESR